VKRTFIVPITAIALALPAIVGAQTMGKSQLADIIGVEAANFTLAELVELDKAIRDEDEERVEVILEQAGSDVKADALVENLGTAEDYEVSVRTGFFDPDYMTGKEVLAENLGVPADAFTLTELVQLQEAVRSNDEESIEQLLVEAGLERNYNLNRAVTVE